MRRPYARIAWVSVCFAAVLSYQGCGAPEHLGSLSDVNGASTTTKACTTASPFEPILPQRIGRNEYNNVIRDLFGLTQNFTVNFMPDQLGGDFTTLAAAQTLSPDAIESYWMAAKVVAKAVADQTTNKFITCESGDPCAQQLIAKLADRAYRRPATDQEKQQLFQLFKAGVSLDFKGRMRLVIQAVLMNPQFIFRTNPIPNANTNDPIPLTHYELASKLSFFIWGSIPDELLTQSAANGTLTQPKVLEDHVRRMLKDPRSSYLYNTFAPQWVKLSKITEKVLDTERFPAWNDSLRESMRMETRTFLTETLKSDNSVLELVSADYSYINSILAGHYGIAGNFTANTYSKTKLPENRKGVITQAAVLTMNSAGDHTLPVVRGKFILENFLCDSPPPPPDDVPTLELEGSGNLTKESQIRERMAEHRMLGPACYSCHQAMDPIGLSFEKFDSSGRYRQAYIDGVAVDSSGELPTGEKLTGAVDLANVLTEDIRFASCFSSKLASFATGRDMTTVEHKCFAQGLAQKTVSKDKKFSDLVVGLVTSFEFLNRKADY